MSRAGTGKIPKSIEPEGVDYSQKDPGFKIGKWDYDAKEWELPEGYRVARLKTIEQFWPAIREMLTQWSQVGFYGGKVTGTGYTDGIVKCTEAEGPLFLLFDHKGLEESLLVRYVDGIVPSEQLSEDEEEC